MQICSAKAQQVKDIKPQEILKKSSSIFFHTITLN